MFLFLYILCAIHHSLRCWYLPFKVKSGSRKISILVFSRFFVYRCHGTLFPTLVPTKLSRRKIVSKRHILKVFSSHFIKALIIFRCIYYYYAKAKVKNVFAIYFETNIQIFFVLVYFVCHTPQSKMLVFAFQSEVWITQDFNFTVFEFFVYRSHRNIDFHKM